MPTQTFEHSATARIDTAEVWKAFDRPDTWEGIAGIDRVFDPDFDGEGRLRGFKFDTIAAGKRYVGTATPEGRVDGRMIAWRIRNSEVVGTTTVTLEPAPSGTLISVKLTVESVGFLSSMFFPVVASAIGNGLPRSVDDFAAGFGD